MKSNSSTSLWLLTASLLLLSTGCASFDLGKRIPWGSGEDGKPVPPVRVMAVWTDTIMTQTNRNSQRGFGGRIVFYDQANEPTKVKGNLVIYAFDETNRDPTNVTPDRKYVFLAEDLEKHYSKGRLGHSYSFWLPWDEVGGRQAEVSLIVRFQPERGGEVVGEQTKHLLPGLTQDMATARQQIQPGVPGAVIPGQLPAPAGQAFPPIYQPGLQQNQLPAPNGVTQANGQQMIGGYPYPAGVVQAAAHQPVINGPVVPGVAPNQLPSVMSNPAQPTSAVTTGNIATEQQPGQQMKSYTIPLRNTNSGINRPLETLRNNQTLAPAPQELPNISQQAALTLQMQQSLLMQQQAAMQQQTQQQVQAASYQATVVPPHQSVTGATPLSGRDGLNFQARQPRPNWQEKSASPAHQEWQRQNNTAPATQASSGMLPGNSPEVLREPPAGSQLSRRQALGGTISRLDPAHVR